MSTCSDGSVTSCPCNCDQKLDKVYQVIQDMQKLYAIVLDQVSIINQTMGHPTESKNQSWVCSNSETSRTRTTSSQTEMDSDETCPQLDRKESLNTESEESSVDMSLVQSTGDTKAPRKVRRRQRRKHNTEKLSKVSQAVQAIHNVAALAGWSEAKLQHELRVFKSKNEKSALSALPNCQKMSNKNCHNTSKVKESLNTVVLPPFPHPMNVPPPRLVPNPRQRQKHLYKKWPACRFSSPSPQQYLNKALPQPITTRTQDFPPERDQSCMSQDRLQTLYFYRSHPPFQKSSFENSTPVEFWRREL